MSNVAFPGGASANYLYFPNAQNKRLQQIKNLNNSNQLISQFDYTYDAEGQVQTWTKNNPSLSTPQRFDLGYDNADQLLTAPLKNASTNALIKQYTYGYDLASNRTSELVGTVTTTSTPNNVNEITSQTGGVNRTLTYDLNGSITNDGSTRTFEWDGANRLVAMNYTGTTNRSEFSYDGLSRVAKIVEKTAGNITSTRKFVWCGKEKCEFRDAADAVTLRVYPQGQHDGTAAYFFTRDHLGSIREMLNSTAAVVVRYDYDPYGRFTSGITLTPPDFNFTGLYRHSKSNLDLATYRAYDPDLGRWISRDPIGEEGGLNLYGYVGNNSINGTDELGLFVEMWYNARTGDFDAYDHDSDTFLHSRAISGDNNLAHVAEGWRGPVPPGYYIAGYPVNHNSEALGGNQTWYHLYQATDDGDWTYNPTGEFDRGQFNLHSGSMSAGCVTFESNTPYGDADYPRNPDFDRLDAMLRSTTPFKLSNRRTYKGTLIVY